MPGVRPGNDTKKFISVILNRITVLGALSLAFIAALPLLIAYDYTVAGFSCP